MANQNQINQLMKQMQQMQTDIADRQAALANTEVEGSAGGGAVTVTATASGSIRAVRIDPSVLDAAEVDLLEDLIVAATNAALQQAAAQRDQQMSEATAGLNLGGLGLPPGLL